MKSTTHLIPHWHNIWKFIRDPKSDWKPKAMVVLTIIYLIWPIDLVPDLIPLLGWLEDIGFNTFAIWYLMHATNKYIETSEQNEK